MKHTLRLPSLGRILSKQRLDAGEELLDDDMTIWTVAEIMAELALLPPDAPVIIATECDEEEDMLFWFDPCEDAEGNKALFIRVDMRDQGHGDTPNV